MSGYSHISVEKIIQDRYEEIGEEMGISLEDCRSKYGQKLIDDIQNILNTEDNGSDVIYKINNLYKNMLEEHRQDPNFPLQDFRHHIGNILSYITLDVQFAA